MAPHRRIAREHGLEEKKCSSDRGSCSPPSPAPASGSAASPAAVVALAALAPTLALPYPATPIQIDDKSHKLTTVVIIVASALAACFLLLTYFTVLRYRSSRRRRSQAASLAAALAGPPQPPPGDNNDDELRADLLVGGGGEEPYHVWYIRTVGLDEPIIGEISVCSYTRGEGLVEGTDCAVCLGEYADGELLRLLPKCSHAFHIPCIDTWLRSHINCPLCRAPILAPPRSSPSPPFPADASATADASAAAADQSDVVAAAGVNSLGAEEEGSEEDGASAVLPASLVAVDHSSLGSSFSSEESEIWVSIDLGNGGLGDGAASGAPLEERNGRAELQPVPRSVSMDSSALGVLLLRMRLAGSSADGRRKPSAGEDPSTTKKVGTEEGNCKGLSLAEGPLEMERSMSGGRFFLSRLSGRPLSAILPL